MSKVNHNGATEASTYLAWRSKAREVLEQLRSDRRIKHSELAKLDQRIKGIMEILRNGACGGTAWKDHLNLDRYVPGNEVNRDEALPSTIAEVRSAIDDLSTVRSGEGAVNGYLRDIQSAKQTLEKALSQLERVSERGR